MDTLRHEDFIFDKSITSTQRINHWKSKGLWFFSIEKAPNNPGKFIAVNDRGRTINMTNGEPILFESKEAAQIVSLSYNDDLIKIRQGSLICWQKNKTGPHYIYL